jgi:methylated-DNA-[protein]-cysteine S-methyltransferase
METAYIKTPLGIATIEGNENGIAVIAIADDGIVSEIIPSVLEQAVTQLQDYFDGQPTHFDFQMNPIGTEFQQKVWKGLCEIPFGKTMSYLELAKQLFE